MGEYYANKKGDMLKGKKGENYLFSLVLFLLMGVLIGSVYSLLLGGNMKAEVVSRFGSIISGKTSGDVWALLQYAFVDNFKLVAIILVFTPNPLGVISTPLLIFSKGVSIGILSAYLYMSMAMKGVLMNLLLFLPGSVISSFCLVYIGKNAMEYSKNVFQVMFKGEKADFKFKTKECFVKILKVCIAFVIMSIPEISFSFLVSSLF